MGPSAVIPDGCRRLRGDEIEAGEGKWVGPEDRGSATAEKARPSEEGLSGHTTSHPRRRSRGNFCRLFCSQPTPARTTAAVDSGSIAKLGPVCVGGGELTATKADREGRNEKPRYCRPDCIDRIASRAFASGSSVADRQSLAGIGSRRVGPSAPHIPTVAAERLSRPSLGCHERAAWDQPADFGKTRRFEYRAVHPFVAQGPDRSHPRSNPTTRPREDRHALIKEAPAIRRAIGIRILARSRGRDTRTRRIGAGRAKPFP